MVEVKELMHRVAEALKSRRGRDVLMFLLFLVISLLLWGVLKLNDEEQIDVRLPVRITNVPDSVTLISGVPEALLVNVKAQGTQGLKMNIGRPPTVNIDFRAHRIGRTVYLNSTELKTEVRNATGGSQVSAVYPDSISIPFTTHRGFKLPVALDSRVTASPRSAMVGRPRLSADSVRVYLASGILPDSVRAIATEPVALHDLDGPVTQRVRLRAPAGSRVVPDSIDVTFEVEPLIIKQRRVVIEPVNVPADIKLITFPAQIDVKYMVPMSAYTHSDPHFRVVADYEAIDRNSRSPRMRLRLLEVPSNLQNVQLSTDSAEYIIERL